MADSDLLAQLPKLLAKNDPCRAVFWTQLIMTLGDLALHAKTPPSVTLGAFISRSASRASQHVCSPCLKPTVGKHRSQVYKADLARQRLASAH